MHRCHPQRLQRQAQRYGKRQDIVLEISVIEDLFTNHPLQRFHPFDRVLQALLQELLQARQFETIATAEHSYDLRIAIDAREIPDRPLDLRHVLVEDRTQSLEDRSRILRLGRIALQVLSLREGQLHILGQCPREMISSQRDIADPDLGTVGNQQRRVVSAHVEHDRVFIRFVFRVLGTDAHLVVADKVVQRHRRDLDQIDFNSRVQEWLQRLVDLVAFHREQADLGIEHIATVFIDAA